MVRLLAPHKPKAFKVSDVIIMFVCQAGSDQQALQIFGSAILPGSVLVLLLQS